MAAANFVFRYVKTSGDVHTIVSNPPLTNDGTRSAWANLTELFENN